MKRVGFVLGCLLLICAAARAQEPGGGVSGVVVDPLGARVAGARVTLMRDGRHAGETTTAGDGEYVIQPVPPGRYEILVRAEGFQDRTSDPFFVGASGRAAVDVSLSIGPLRQEVVVTATGIEMPVSQIGAQITVLDARTLDGLGKPDVLEALRLVPGSQVVQTGQRGGVTSFFVRGGAASFNKVLVDGVPANDIGGGFDFAGVSIAGVDRIEVLRESNSVLFGADSLAGVVSLTTRRGRARIPEAAVSIDGGSLHTLRSAASVGGAAGRYDYFSEYAAFRTDNDLPNNAFRNGTYAGRFGFALGGHTDMSATIRRADTRSESPNAVRFFGVPDDSRQEGDATYVALAAQSQAGSRLQATIRFASMAQNTRFENPAPSGEPFDPFGFGASYLGDTVTIRGANGYSVAGRAILDFGGPYPSVFDGHTTRRLIFGQAMVRLAQGLDLSGGGRVEWEDGFTQSGSSPRSESARDNRGAFLEARASAPRVFVSGGVGVEHNAVFGRAVSPRVSAAVYLRGPSASALVGDTKVIVNAGKGVKAPAIYQELSSLFVLLQPAQAGALGAGPIGPERARNLDVGIEQGLSRGRLRVRGTVFHNTFEDLIEFVSRNVLPQVGVPAAAAAAAPFGAYVNSQSYRARGLELSADAMVAGRVRAAASYTYLDSVVVESFSGGALSPAMNPAFPGIPIGAFSPLVGARPFRQSTHSGSVLLSYARGPADVTLAGSFAGARDDSTYLSDAFFGTSMLLPNGGLAPAYQKLDLSAAYRLHRRLKWYASLENLGGEQYEAAFGYPGLPRTVRTGMAVTFGGDAQVP